MVSIYCIVNIKLKQDDLNTLRSKHEQVLIAIFLTAAFTVVVSSLVPNDEPDFASLQVHLGWQVCITPRHPNVLDVAADLTSMQDNEVAPQQTSKTLTL